MCVNDVHHMLESPPLLWHKITGLQLNGLGGAQVEAGEGGQMDTGITLSLALWLIRRNPVRVAFLLHEKKPPETGNWKVDPAVKLWEENLV